MIEKPKTIKNKVTKQWLAFRKDWIKRNPPDYKGDYICGICNSPVFWKGMHLDHIQNRSTDPELRYKDANVRPTHPSCNIGRKTGKR